MQASRISIPAGVSDPSTGAITCEVVTEWAALEPMRKEWDAFLARTDGDLFFTYDWCRTWWRHYGGRYQLRVLLLRRDGDLVGLLPMMIDRMWLGPVRLRLAKLVGSECTTVVLNPPVVAAEAEAVYAAAFAYLLKQGRCDGIRLHLLGGARPHREQIRRVCEASGSGARLIRDRDLVGHSLLELPETFEAYLASLSAEQRGSLRRKRRRFESECRYEVEFLEEPAQVAEAFEEFLALHQARWQADGMPGHFGEHPHSVEFNRDLIRTLAPLGRVWMTRLRVDGEAVACEYNYVFNGVLYWRLPGARWENGGSG